MAGKVGGDDSDMMSDINVTPFVDIVLVLLIILMVTSTEIVRATIQVDLPQAASGGETVESTLNIIITKDGEFFVDGIKATEDDIIYRVRTEKQNNPKLQAVIAADQGVTYNYVVRAIDLVKENGVTSFALNVDREKKEER
jgi:biopolymer transport protein ExbD